MANKTNSNVDIFISSYKEFVPEVKNKSYKIVYSRNVNTDNGSKLKSYVCKNQNLLLNDLFYSELYNYKYIADHVKLKKYVGFCHYRKYWGFLDNIPDMDELFKEYGCIVAFPLNFKTTIREHYATSHNREDIEIVEHIIEEKYPEYNDVTKLFLDKNKIFIPYNMFIMKSEDFIKYIDFVFGIINEYLKITGIDLVKRIEDNKDKYLKSFYPNNTIWYQYRIGGYIGERLTNIFMFKHFKKMKAYSINITENKYKDGEKTT